MPGADLRICEKDQNQGLKKDRGAEEAAVEEAAAFQRG